MTRGGQVLTAGPLAMLLSLSVLFLVGCSDEPHEPQTSSGANSAPTLARNLILISIDTLRPDKLGCYGYERPTSPTIDRLAADGVLFENAMTTAPWTLPAHTSLFSGLYPRHHGVDSESKALPSSITTMAQILSERGFETAAVLSNSRLNERHELNRGFDIYQAVSRDAVRENPFATVDRAIAWLKVPRAGGFFLFIHDFHVHTNYASSKKYEDQFVAPYRGRIVGTVNQLKRFRKGTLTLDDADLSHLIDLYVSGIRQSDESVQRLLGVLNELDLEEETLVILLSDHGEEFLEHGGVLHGRTQYQELTRIPLMMRGPGIPEGRRIATPVSIVDVFPTALSLMGVSGFKETDGWDLTALWSAGPGSENQTPDRILFSEADHRNEEPGMLLSARRGRHKVHFNRLTGESRLFDLVNDPGESIDIGDSEPEVVAMLMDALQEFIATEVEGVSLGELDAAAREQLQALGYLDEQKPEISPANDSAPMR